MKRQASFKDYTVTITDSGSAEVHKLCKNTTGGLRELSELMGFEYDKKWGPQTFANKIIDAIESCELKKPARLNNAKDAFEDDKNSAQLKKTKVTAPKKTKNTTKAKATDIILKPKNPTEIETREFIGQNFKSAVIPNGVTKIGMTAFAHCCSLESITIPNSVTEISMLAFYNCTSLTSVVLPNSLIEVEAYLFKECSSLSSITLPNSVNKINCEAFLGCSSLLSITIPKSVTTIEFGAFKDCTSLKSITIPNSVVKIGVNTFENCDSLKTITIPKRFKDEVSRIEIPKNCKIKFI